MPPSLAAAWSWPYLRPRSVRPPFPEGKQAEDGAFFVACSLCVWWPAARGSDPPFTLCPLGEDSTTLTVTAAQQFPPRVHSLIPGAGCHLLGRAGGVLLRHRQVASLCLIVQVQDSWLDPGVRYSKKSLLECCLASYCKFFEVHQCASCASMPNHLCHHPHHCVATAETQEG